MLVVEQGQVAVMKAYVGLPTQDTSGIEFKFGSLVRPGHRGIWQEPLRTGKYPINPRCYQAVIVPTFIITLNWADVVSQAHNLDAQLKQIEAKSSEGFHFAIDLQVQIHIPDTQAPYVISMVGSVANLVNEVLQAAVGNHFRNKLQSMPAVSFIATREAVQQGAFEDVKEELAKYRVETRGVYIQAVVLPEQLVEVLTEREIANQQVATYKMQKSAQDQRTETEKAKGTADMQADLAKSQVGVDIQSNRTAARKMEAQGEATFIEQTGAAQGAQVKSIGLARAEAYDRQVAALGANATALVNAVEALSKSNVPFMPNTLVMGGSDGSGTLGGVLPDVSVTTVALALLLVVLGAATLSRLPVAIVVSIAAMLTLNFFFLPPVGTFTIADPQNWIALAAFLVVAVIASNLSAAAQQRTREAVARRNEVTRLFDLTRDVLLTTQTASAMDALARHVARRFDLTTVAICLPAEHGWRIHQGGIDEAVLSTDTLNTAMATARGTLEFDARQRAYGGHVRAQGPKRR